MGVTMWGTGYMYDVSPTFKNGGDSPLHFFHTLNENRSACFIPYLQYTWFNEIRLDNGVNGHLMN